MRLEVKYVGELPGTAPARALRVATDTDYCGACAALRRDLAAQYDALWVAERHHFIWLQTFVNHTGISHLRQVDFADMAARDVLSARWQLVVPDWLSEEVILADDLLNRAVPPGSHESVASVLLAPWLESVPDKFPRNQAGALAEKAASADMQAGLSTSASASAAWMAMLDSWAAANPVSWVSTFCERLRENPEKLWADLTVWRFLSRYPNAQQEFALDPAAVTFVRDIPQEALKGMSPQPKGKSLALDQIQPLFEHATAGGVTRAKFDALLAAVSGELPEEFRGVEKLMSLATFPIGQRDVDAVHRRFKDCPGVTPSALSTLRLYVRPPQPSAMAETNADAAAWLRWVQSEYIPFRWWQAQRGVSDPDVEMSVVAFSTWYCDQFIQVHSDPVHSAVQTLAQWRSQITQDDVSLILLVDNLPLFFWDAFERALALSGLHKHQSGSRFAPLPSLTAVCKPALISGGWDATGSDYRPMLEKRSAAEWDGRPVRYLSGVDQLNGMKSVAAPSVVLLNYLASDEALHADSAAAGTTHSEQLGLLYASLANAVGEFARRASEGGRAFGLYVITDHGATRILAAEKQSVDAALAQRLFPNEKYRSATMSSAAANQIPPNIWALGHRFTNPYRPEGEVCFIPRGHNTVAAPGPRPLYSHGGATPEEVVTPCGVFRLSPASWQAPSVRFLDLRAGRAVFYVKRMATIRIEIQNPNSEAVHVESLAIIPAVGDVRTFDRATVRPQAVGSMTASLYFMPEATTSSALTVEIAFRIAQEIIVRRVDLPVTISSAMSGGTDLTALVP